MADTDLFDQLIKSAPWLVVPATLLTAAPKILEFWQGFAGARDGRKQLEIEKARLENLKLRIEIEALQKQQGTSLDVAAIPTAQQMSDSHKPDPRPPVEKKIWGWLDRLARKWPALTGMAVNGLVLVCTWLGIFMILFYATIAASMWFSDPKEDLGYFMLGGFIAYLLPSLLLLKIGSSLKTQRRLLHNGVQPPAT